jgi:hypothetical protein
MKCRRAVLVKKKIGRVNSRVPSAVHCVQGRQQRPQLRPVYCIVHCIVVPVYWTAAAGWANVQLEFSWNSESNVGRKTVAFDNYSR